MQFGLISMPPIADGLIPMPPLIILIMYKLPVFHNLHLGMYVVVFFSITAHNAALERNALDKKNLIK